MALHWAAIVASIGSNLTLVGSGEGVVVEEVDLGVLDDDDDDAAGGEVDEEKVERVFKGAVV